MKQCKIVAVGDEGVGKTAIFMACSRNTRCIEKDELMPSIQDHQYEVTVDDDNCLVCLWDTSGKSQDDQLRHLGYPQTSVFLVCFDVSKRETFDNLEQRWLPEIKRHAKSTPVILVANKIDLRHQMKEIIRIEEGSSIAHKHGMKYVECSAIIQAGIEDIVPTSVRMALSNAQTSKGKSKLTATGQKCKIF